jgi:hypothetical protein
LTLPLPFESKKRAALRLLALCCRINAKNYLSLPPTAFSEESTLPPIESEDFFIIEEIVS